MALPHVVILYPSSIQHFRTMSDLVIERLRPVCTNSDRTPDRRSNRRSANQIVQMTSRDWFDLRSDVRSELVHTGLSHFEDEPQWGGF